MQGCVFFLRNCSDYITFQSDSQIQTEMMEKVTNTWCDGLQPMEKGEDTPESKVSSPLINVNKTFPYDCIGWALRHVQKEAF